MSNDINNTGNPGNPGNTINLSLLGLSISVREGADSARITDAVEEVRQRFEDQSHRTRGTTSTREQTLIWTALGLADDLLQLKRQLQDAQARMQALLNHIEQSR